MNGPKDIAQRLREIREQLGLTQVEMGELIYKQKSSVSKYENGDAEPPYAVVSRYVELSGRSYDWIFTGQEAEGGEGVPERPAGEVDNPEALARGEAATVRRTSPGGDEKAGETGEKEVPLTEAQQRVLQHYKDDPLIHMLLDGFLRLPQSKKLARLSEIQADIESMASDRDKE